MIEGMESFIGLKLNAQAIEDYGEQLNSYQNYILTRPDDCGENIHINMYIFVDENYVITDVDGNKCYSYYRGMYNRSSSVYMRPFSKRDLAYLKRFLKKITKK